MFVKSLFDTQLPLLRLNLQHFAEGEGEGEGAGGEPGEGQQPTTVTLTEQELQDRLQREADRRVSEALKKFEAKKQKEFEQRIEEERREAEELAKLSQEERLKVEREKEAMKFQEEKKALETERQAFQREKLFLETEKVLASEKLPTDFASFLLGEDAEKTHENIKVFKDQFQQAVQEQVNDVLKGKTPLVGSGKQLSEVEQLEKERQEALKRRDMPTAIALKNKIFQLQNK